MYASAARQTHSSPADLSSREGADEPGPKTDGSLVDGLDALRPQDVQAICRELKLPLPTPDVPLSSILEDARMTPTDVYVRLSRCTSVDAMIAAAALRGVRRLAPDPRLKPEPHRLRWSLTPEGRAGAPAPRPTRSTEDPGMPPADHVLTHVGECASAPGSRRAERFAKYCLGLTVEEVRQAGVKLSDVRRHISEGLIAFGPRPTGETESVH